MISQHWFRQWLVAVRQQAITWTNVDQVLRRHMASPGHNVLTAPVQHMIKTGHVRIIIQGTKLYSIMPWADIIMHVFIFHAIHGEWHHVHKYDRQNIIPLKALEKQEGSVEVMNYVNGRIEIKWIYWRVSSLDIHHDGWPYESSHPWIELCVGVN